MLTLSNPECTITAFRLDQAKMILVRILFILKHHVRDGSLSIGHSKYLQRCSRPLQIEINLQRPGYVE